MQFPVILKQKMILAICAFILSISLFSYAQDEDNLFGASLDVTYAGPNVWARFSTFKRAMYSTNP